MEMFDVFLLCVIIYLISVMITGAYFIYQPISQYKLLPIFMPLFNTISAFMIIVVFVIQLIKKQ